MLGALQTMQGNLVRRVLTAQAHIELLPPKEVARPQRSDEPGSREMAIIQQPLQRLRSLDQWQSLVGQLRQIAAFRCRGAGCQGNFSGLAAVATHFP